MISGVMYNPDLYLSNMLQMFTECLENYHREFMEKNSIIKVERKMKRDRVMKDLENLIILAKKEKLSVFVNNSDLDWLKDKVKNISPTLRERISEIYDKYLDLIKIFSTIEEKEEILKKVKCYRDNFSHAKLKYHTIDNEDLLWTVEKLHLFVKLVFLTRLGFTNEDIKRLYIPENV